MKVILLQDVANVGKRFEVADVPKGHAMNMLIPRGMAQTATPENMNRLKERMARVGAVSEAKSEDFEKAVAAVKGTTQTLALEANEKGHLFESVKAEQVAAVLVAGGNTVSADQIDLGTTLKEVGEFPVTLKHGDHSAAFTLKIEAK